MFLFLPDGFLYYCFIIRHAPNDRMFVDKLQFLLPGAASLDQSPDCLESKGIVCKSDLTGLVDAVTVVMVGKIQQSYENAYTRDTSCFEHGLCPFVCIGSNQRSFAKHPDSAFFNL